MKKIIIGGSMNPLNKGDQARIKATIKKLTDDRDIQLALLSHCIEGDQYIYSEEAIEIVKAPWAGSSIRVSKMALIAAFTLLRYSLSAFAQKFLGIRSKAKLFEYDALAITSGIDFSDFAGRWPIYYSLFLTTLFGIVMQKPVMCYAQSMGPIQNRVVRRLAGFFLNRMKTISVREENSLVFLSELKIKRPQIYYTADPAFLLQPNSHHSTAIQARPEIRDARRPLIGITLNPRPYAGPGTGYCSIGLWFRLNKQNDRRLSNYYLQKMSRICDRLVTEYGATLVFIPNCTAKGDDDRETMKRVLERMDYQDRGICITDDIGLLEITEIIGTCDLFVSTRLHAIILASIMGVPVVPLVGTDGPRIPGIIKMLGLDSYLRNVLTTEESQIMSAIGEAWNSRHELQKTILLNVSEVRTRALDNIRVFREFCSLDNELFIASPDQAVTVPYTPTSREYKQ
jgi:colanic acid/amylovoran biosynthesis protein